MKKLQHKLHKTDAYLITDPANIRYLANFSGTNGTLLLTRKKIFFFTDPRYTRVAKKVLPRGVELLIASPFSEELTKLLKKLKVRTLWFEAHDVSFQKHKILKKIFPHLKPGLHFVEQYRMIKTQEELQLIIRSQRINERTFRQVVKALKTGKTEKQVAWEIEKTGRELGADGISFEPIVGFGVSSGSPHHMNTNRKLRKGDMVLLDMGMEYRGYCSDMTRTMFTAKPTRLQEKIYNTVLEAQEAAIKKLKAGMKGSAADKISRDIITKAGYGPQFGHSLGHGIGLEVHELPNLSTIYTKPLPLNTVVTVEPGIYLENSFGVRIEDMVIIRRNKAENITKIPKKIPNLILSVS